LILKGGLEQAALLFFGSIRESEYREAAKNW